jgi:circadian clock protein KaiC
MTALIGDTAASPGYGRKALTGLPGFDALAGGIPAERMSVVCGGAGSGKTVFALQSLINGWRLYGEPGVFVSFEEDTEEVLSQAVGFGWTGTAEDDRVRVIGARPDVDSVLAGDFDLRALLAGLGSLVEKMKAKRVIFDALDALLVLMENRTAERREFYRAYNWAKDLRLTAISTANVDSGEQVPQQAFLEYLADSVIFLNHREGQILRTPGSASRSNRWAGNAIALTVIKSRGTAHSNQVRELLLSSEGITLADVYSAGGGGADGNGTIREGAGERAAGIGTAR